MEFFLGAFLWLFIGFVISILNYRYWSKDEDWIFPVIMVWPGLLIFLLIIGLVNIVKFLGELGR